MKPGTPIDRREFLLSSGLALALPALSRARDEAPAGWESVPGTLSRIRPPLFPDRDFTITGYGARDDGRTDCTDAIARAVAACHGAGGGRVLVPAGAFLTGPIHLRSGVDLHLAADALQSLVYQAALSEQRHHDLAEQLEAARAELGELRQRHGGER